MSSSFLQANIVDVGGRLLFFHQGEGGLLHDFVHALLTIHIGVA